MIKLTRLNGDSVYLNPFLIERIEMKPDTMITMNSQTQYLVKEGAEVVMELIKRGKILLIDQ